MAKNFSLELGTELERFHPDNRVPESQELALLRAVLTDGASARQCPFSARLTYYR